ncbi:hypothetical protein ACFQ1L_12585 [Phytohabitans flavus]|uniref:hypothetical protein n=1 Tax=Phytohabitans flavus TaxID=1076124 RepID=UPI0036419498
MTEVRRLASQIVTQAELVDRRLGVVASLDPPELRDSSPSVFAGLGLAIDAL